MTRVAWKLFTSVAARSPTGAGRAAGQQDEGDLRHQAHEEHRGRAGGAGRVAPDVALLVSGVLGHGHAEGCSVAG